MESDLVGLAVTGSGCRSELKRCFQRPGGLGKTILVGSPFARSGLAGSSSAILN